MKRNLFVTLLFLLCSSGLMYGDPVPSAQISDPTERLAIQRAERIAGSSYIYDFRTGLGQIAMAYPNRLILIDPDALVGADEYTQMFALISEMGHEKMGHTVYQEEIEGIGQPWLRPQMVLQADRFAVSAMLDNGLKKEKILEMATALLQNSPEDPAHPAGSVRISAIRQAIGLGSSGGSITRKGNSGDTGETEQPPREPPVMESGATAHDVISQVISAAADGFQSIRGKKLSADAGESAAYAAAINYPGAVKSTVFTGSRGVAAYVSYTLYDGADGDKATDAYNRCLRDVSEVVASWPVTNTKDDATPPSMKSTFQSPEGGLRIVVSVNASTARSTVRINFRTGEGQ
jgi:hypothetical protein